MSNIEVLGRLLPLGLPGYDGRLAGQLATAFKDYSHPIAGGSEMVRLLDVMLSDGSVETVSAELFEPLEQANIVMFRGAA